MLQETAIEIVIACSYWKYLSPDANSKITVMKQ